MAKLNRRYIDKHWMVFMVRGVLAAAFGCYALFGGMNDITNVIAVISVLLLLMGIIDHHTTQRSIRKHEPPSLSAVF